ncbi:MAG: cellulase family glycosylhydrolase [Verrucomicrobiia bacterium]
MTPTVDYGSIGDMALREPIAILCLFLAAGCSTTQPSAQREWIVVGGDGKGFVCQPSGKPFTPWGFNYDHDHKSRLIEDYWESEWPTVEADFSEMKALGANVVRVHLQFGRFMNGPHRPNARSLARLEKLVTLCEELGLYLDLTGLGCYRKQDTPAWYDALNEPQRWQTQANFWRAIARQCASRNSVFAYDLMNEPVVPGERLDPGTWLHPASLGGFHFVQRITLDAAGRDHSEVFRAWVRQLAEAIHEVDRRHLVTVGLLPITSGYAYAAAAEMDYVSVHIYPEKGKLEESLQTLQRFCVGKPVVVEEMFPLNCDADELGAFIERSKELASGWIGFYWGRTLEELRGSKQMADALTLRWLELFQKINPNR